MNTSLQLDELVAAVQAGGKYTDICPELVRWIGQRELSKGRTSKEAVKATRARLHQVGGAYLDQIPAYSHWRRELASLPRDLAQPELRAFCQARMAEHASTRERLSFIDTFYTRILGPLAPIESILDLACGLNPLALPWMLLSAETEYQACDIFQGMVTFIHDFLLHTGMRGEAQVCNLVEAIPQRPVHVALLLKLIPCLEHLDKSIGRRLLETVPARHLVVSFPSRSLGGRNVGMADTYSGHFADLTSGKSWQVQRFDFPNEIVFVLSK